MDISTKEAIMKCEMIPSKARASFPHGAAFSAFAEKIPRNKVEPILWGRAARMGATQKGGLVFMLKSVLTLLPIVWLIVALAGLKLPGHKACLAALAIAAVLALTLWRMPVVDCTTSALEGFAAALWDTLAATVKQTSKTIITILSVLACLIVGLLQGVASI